MTTVGNNNSSGDEIANVNFFTTTSYNTSKCNLLLNIQHDAGRGAASGCGLVVLAYSLDKLYGISANWPSRRDVWQSLNIHVRPAAGHSTAGPWAAACTAEPRQGNNGWLNIAYCLRGKWIRKWKSLYLATPLVFNSPWWRASPGKISVKFFVDVNGWYQMP